MAQGRRPAQILFTPADEDDLAYFLSRCPAELPMMVMGVGSNLLVRDGGVPGVTIRLARGFNEVTPLGGTRIRAGAAAPRFRAWRRQRRRPGSQGSPSTGAFRARLAAHCV